jgi:hypothetical protein
VLEAAAAAWVSVMLAVLATCLVEVVWVAMAAAAATEAKWLRARVAMSSIVKVASAARAALGLALLVSTG